MRHTLYGLISLILSSADFTTCAAFAADARPKAVYIRADELRYCEPRFYAGARIQTPNLDRMSADGMWFKNLLTGSSACAPTRRCFLTGKHSGQMSVRAQAPADVDGLSILPKLIGEQAAGHIQQQHDFLYWESGGAIAIRQDRWRAVRPKPNARWKSYDLAADPCESKEFAAAKLDIVARIDALAAKAHSPAVEITFARTNRHERDRRAKTGQRDNPSAPDPLAGGQGKSGREADHPINTTMLTSDNSVRRINPIQLLRTL